MPWDTETEKYELHEKWHEKVFGPRGARAPEFLDKEPIDHYRKRLTTNDLPLNFHPKAIRASAGFTRCGAGGATCDRRS
jgi:hypothetical protein